MTINGLLNYGVKKLKERELDNPVNKAKILLANLLNVQKEYLVINQDKSIDDEKVTRYKQDIDDLIIGKPLQYITNSVEFMRLKFYVDENVLIPRPDTEILVEEVINASKEFATLAKGRMSQSDRGDLKILDLCTGSGAIAISLEKYIHNSEVYASDISEKALKIAKLNNNYNNTKVKFIKSDLFNDIEIKDFDIIVSNPPYIETNIIKTLDPEVQKEPYIALNGGEDGMTFYKKIIQSASEYLKPKGYLFLEIGYNQKQGVTDLLNENGYYIEIECIKDLNGLDRVIKSRSYNK